MEGPWVFDPVLLVGDQLAVNMQDVTSGAAKAFAKRGTCDVPYRP